jgi:hypothetical protein
MEASSTMEKQAEAAIAGPLEVEGFVPGRPADRVILIPVDGSPCSNSAIELAISSVLRCV